MNHKLAPTDWLRRVGNRQVRTHGFPVESIIKWRGHQKPWLRLCCWHYGQDNVAQGPKDEKHSILSIFLFVFIKSSKSPAIKPSYQGFSPDLFISKCRAPRLEKMAQAAFPESAEASAAPAPAVPAAPALPAVPAAARAARSSWGLQKQQIEMSGGLGVGGR